MQLKFIVMTKLQVCIIYKYYNVTQYKNEEPVEDMAEPSAG